MKLPIRYYGDAALRQKAEPVAEITDEIRQLAEDMIETMMDKNGIGLAATQVGKMVRIFISNIDHEDEEGEVHLGEPVVYINPVLSNHSDTLVERSEGCLSLPGLHAPVVRPLTVEIEAMDVNGETFRKECYGYLARCLMHENDHLNGVLFIDRIKGKRRSLLDPELRRIKQEFYKKI